VIHDVIIEPLRQIIDERGKIMHMLRCDSIIFEKFGEIYFSFVNPGVVKAWKLHNEMTLNLAVPYGMIKLILYDKRQESPTKGEIQEIVIGSNNYCLVKIPPQIWNGFQGVDSTVSIVANCATIPHDPEEIKRLDPFDPSIPYTWENKQ